MADAHKRRRERRLRASIEGLEDRRLLSAFGRLEGAQPSRFWASSLAPAEHADRPAPAFRTIEAIPHSQVTFIRATPQARRSKAIPGGFAQATFDVNENAGAALIEVMRSGNVKSKVALTVATNTLGTAVPGVNFTPIEQTLIFTEGVRTQTFSVPVIDDQVAGPDLTVGLALSASSRKMTLSGLSTAILTIHNVDPPPPPPPPAAAIQFSTTGYTVNEDAGTVGIQITRTVDSQVPASVTVATTSGGSAAQNVNYMATTQTLTFAAGVNSQTFNVPILDDHDDDPDLTVDLALSAPGGNAILGSPSTAILTIHNVDPPPPPPAAVIQFSAASYTVNEDAGTVGIQITRTVDSQVPVSVTVATTSGGSAAQNVNYMATTQTLTFAAGVNSQTFNVPILDDHDDDPDLTVDLALSAPGGDAVLGSPLTAILTIHNVDPPPPAAIQFSAASYAVNEDAGTAGIQITRTVDSQVPVSVTVATISGGSAAQNVNYTPTTQTLTFAAGVNSQTFNVPILDDHDDDPDLTVDLALRRRAGMPFSEAHRRPY